MGFSTVVRFLHSWLIAKSPQVMHWQGMKGIEMTFAISVCGYAMLPTLARQRKKLDVQVSLYLWDPKWLIHDFPKKKVPNCGSVRGSCLKEGGTTRPGLQDQGYLSSRDRKKLAKKSCKTHVNWHSQSRITRWKGIRMNSLIFQAFGA